MKIRNAVYNDAPAIKFLLAGFGQEITVSRLIVLMETVFDTGRDVLLVAGSAGELLGFAALHFVPTLQSEILFVNQLHLAERASATSVSEALEQEIMLRASQRGCYQVEWNSSLRKEPVLIK